MVPRALRLGVLSTTVLLLLVVLCQGSSDHLRSITAVKAADKAVPEGAEHVGTIETSHGPISVHVTRGGAGEAASGGSGQQEEEEEEEEEGSASGEGPGEVAAAAAKAMKKAYKQHTAQTTALEKAVAEVRKLNAGAPASASGKSGHKQGGESAAAEEGKDHHSNKEQGEEHAEGDKEKEEEEEKEKEEESPGEESKEEYGFGDDDQGSMYIVPSETHVAEGTFPKLPPTKPPSEDGEGEEGAEACTENCHAEEAKPQQVAGPVAMSQPVGDTDNGMRPVKGTRTVASPPKTLTLDWPGDLEKRERQAHGIDDTSLEPHNNHEPDCPTCAQKAAAGTAAKPVAPAAAPAAAPAVAPGKPSAGAAPAAAAASGSGSPVVSQIVQAASPVVKLPAASFRETTPGMGGAPASSAVAAYHKAVLEGQTQNGVPAAATAGGVVTGGAQPHLHIPATATTAVPTDRVPRPVASLADQQPFPLLPSAKAGTDVFKQVGFSGYGAVGGYGGSFPGYYMAAAAAQNAAEGPHNAAAYGAQPYPTALDASNDNVPSTVRNAAATATAARQMRFREHQTQSQAQPQPQPSPYSATTYMQSAPQQSWAPAPTSQPFGTYPTQCGCVQCPCAPQAAQAGPRFPPPPPLPRYDEACPEEPCHRLTPMERRIRREELREEEQRKQDERKRQKLHEEMYKHQMNLNTISRMARLLKFQYANLRREHMMLRMNIRNNGKALAELKIAPLTEAADELDEDSPEQSKQKAAKAMQELIKQHQEQADVLEHSQKVQAAVFDKFKPVIKHWEAFDQALSDRLGKASESQEAAGGQQQEPAQQSDSASSSS